LQKHFVEPSIVTGSVWRNNDHQRVEGRKAKYKVLFPVQAMDKVYRAYFLKQLDLLKNNGTIKITDDQKAGWYNFIQTLRSKEWVVYAKEPFGGPAQVIEYLGRYTNKVAISNHRISSVSEAGEVTFKYKDYADQDQIKQMSLPGLEFIRRFEQHILPKRFCKIRSYGIYGNHNRHRRVSMILKKLPLPPQRRCPGTLSLWNGRAHSRCCGRPVRKRRWY